MKKIYTLSFLLLAGISTSYGQKYQQAITKDFTTDVVKSEKVINAKTAGVQFWADDFTTPANWTIDNGSSTSNEFGWSIDAVVDGWWSLPAGINSTSGGNYLELSNGDPTATAPSQATGVTYTVTTANSIDLTTVGTNVILEFEQYGARFNDLQEIQISTDGITFVPVGNNLNYTVLSQSGGSAYPNPDLKTINLSSFLTGATQVWIRFSWTTNFPASTSANAWIAYGWYIDDVTLTTSSDNDIQVTGNYYESLSVKYSKVPVSQIQPVTYHAVVNNNGINTIQNAQYDATIAPGAVTVSSVPVSIAPLTIGDTLTTASFTPPGLGTYTASGAVFHDSLDDVPGNNTIASSSFEVTPFIYALDNGVVSGTTQDNDLATVFEVGNVFDCVAPVDCWGVFARIGTGTPAGNTNGIFVNAQLRMYDAAVDDYIVVATSNAVQVQANMVNAEKFYKFDNAYTLQAGETYLATMYSSDEGMRIANAGSSLIGTSLIQYSDDLVTWFYQTNTPWVRLNFDPSLGLEEATGSLSATSVYPNPTTGNSEVTFALENTQDINVTVYDVAGQLVFSNNMGTVQKGTHSFEINSAVFNAGVYMVNISTNDGVVTKKLIKK
jgi:hypothetical protein